MKLPKSYKIYEKEVARIWDTEIRLLDLLDEIKGIKLGKNQEVFLRHHCNGDEVNLIILVKTSVEEQRRLYREYYKEMEIYHKWREENPEAVKEQAVKDEMLFLKRERNKVDQKIKRLEEKKEK